MSFMVMIGALTIDACHSEIEVESRDDAVVHLHAYARKAEPEGAIANIGPNGEWIGNDGWASIDIWDAAIRERVEKLVKEENEQDEQAALDCNQFIPDIKIQPTAEGVALVSSVAMQYECHIQWDRLGKEVDDLIREYQDLVAAGEVSKPQF